MGKQRAKVEKDQKSVEEELVEGNREAWELINSTKHLILDESDRLLSQDFLPQITPIVEACTHPEIQKCFLSATMPAGPEAIASKWLNEGVRVVVGLKWVFLLHLFFVSYTSSHLPPQFSSFSSSEELRSVGVEMMVDYLRIGSHPRVLRRDWGSGFGREEEYDNWREWDQMAKSEEWEMSADEKEEEGYKKTFQIRRKSDQGRKMLGKS
jgi:hypothetical protein